MSLLRLILILLFLYFVIRIVRLLIQFVNSQKNRINNPQENNSIRSSSFDKSKYKDIQEAEFKEIKSDDKSKTEPH